jgi:hypothetical protein
MTWQLLLAAQNGNPNLNPSNRRFSSTPLKKRFVYCTLSMGLTGT